MRTLHLYVGCFFAPLLIYFVISGMWQVFHFHHHPRGQEPTQIQSVLHALSDPHTDGTFPGKDPKDSASVLFRIFLEIMSLGFILTAFLGIQMAYQVKRRQNKVTLVLIIGAILPLLLLLIHS